MSKILYVSALISESKLSDIYKTTGRNPGFAVQKFSRLIVKGLIENGAQVVAMSNPPISTRDSKEIIVRLKDETENKIFYKYIPYINLSFLKHICVFIYTFFYILFWGFTKRKDKCVICDALSVSASMAAIFATKLNKVKCCGVFTDIYGLLVGNKESLNILKKIASKITNFYNQMFTHYVFLTKEMNNVINKKQRPYIVMEALCDIVENYSIDSEPIKDIPRVILYAGGIEERYGLKMLVDAFLKLSNIQAELHIYGSGSYASELTAICKNHMSVKYFGVRPNEEIINAEHRATILVNPRFTTEEFTKYSFPSKNMEYMVSGTPVLTTMLPGMPDDYKNYIFLIEEETLDGYSSAISSVMNLDNQELKEKGKKARKFVLENKNNIIQAEKIIKLLNIK